jgi:hypothetical protein
MALVVVGCSAPLIPSLSTSFPPQQEPSAAPGRDRLTGEVVFDGAWPSAYREGCLSLETDDGFVELVSSEPWFKTTDPDTGWFDIRDESDAILMQEHRLVTLTGSFLAADGCREGRLFEVAGFEPPPQAQSTLAVEVVGGIGAIEGTVNLVRVLGPDGAPLLQQPVGPGESMAIPSGSMTLVVFQKICDANCGMAYGSLGECEIPLEMDPDGEVTLTVILTSEPPLCELALRDGGPADVVAHLEIAAFDSAALPYEGVERCVKVGSVVPVLPGGWRLVATEPQPDRWEVVIEDPAGAVVARTGDIVWLDGVETGEQGAFGCDYGARFDVTEVVSARRPSR